METSLMGLVSNISMVPFFFSSANIFIVMAEIKNKNSQGLKANNPSKEAIVLSKILKLQEEELITQRNKPLTKRKTTMVIYPISEVKKLLISFLYNVHILSFIIAFKFANL